MPTRIRVLFLAWGHSIHAQRRIQLFCDDPRFEVGVVADFNYDFKPARNYLLVKAGNASAPTNQSELVNGQGGTVQPVSAFGLARTAYRTATKAPLVGPPLHEAVTSVRDLRQIRRAMREFAPHVVFQQTLKYPCYLDLFVRNDVPRVITFWNGDVIWWSKTTGAERVFKKQIVTLGARRATAITVNSEEARRACLRYGVEESRIHLIRYPGVELARFAERPTDAAKRELGFAGNKLVISQRGPAHYQNLDVLVNAMPAVLKSEPTTKFLFLMPGLGGGAESFAALRDQAQRLGVNHACVWQGNLPHHQMPVALAAADVAVSISSEDSTPNSMLEAMAARTPLVMGDIAPIRDWVRHEHEGLLVDCRDEKALASAILRLLHQPDLALRLTQRAYAVVEERASSRTQVPQVLDLVAQIGRNYAKLH